MSLQNIQTEVDVSFLYKILAESEKDEKVAKVFYEMSEIELSHATSFLKINNLSLSQLPQPSWRAKLLRKIGSLIGNEYILGVLIDTEKSIASAVLNLREKTQSEKSISDMSHVAILKNILNNHKYIPSNHLMRFEKRHRTVGGNALRAAVLGGNDGLVSNFSLVMGIAGASSNQQVVLITGLAGLLAGALSMALGEWISVKSSQELIENQMQLEMEELECNPEGEKKELVLIYISKGIDEDKAHAMAEEIMMDRAQAHSILIKEELGINQDEIQGSPWEAAIASFILFAIGAIIPVLPFFFIGGLYGILISTLLSALGLFAIGGVITLFTNKSVWSSGLRQVVFGLAAATITYLIGSLIGVNIK